MFNTVNEFEQLLEIDISKTPYFVAMKVLRDALTKELLTNYYSHFSAMTGGMPQGKNANALASDTSNRIVAKMRVEVTEDAIAAEDFQKTINLFAKLLARVWNYITNEFGPEACDTISQKFELVLP